MGKYLIKFNDDYADEFDVNEAEIVLAAELALIKQYLAVEEIKAARETDERNGDGCQEEHLRLWYDDFSFCYCFGTNEQLEYEGLYGMKRIWRNLKITPITDAEIAVVKKFGLINDCGFVTTLLEAAVEYDFDIHRRENEELDA